MAKQTLAISPSYLQAGDVIVDGFLQTKVLEVAFGTSYPITVYALIDPPVVMGVPNQLKWTPNLTPGLTLTVIRDVPEPNPVVRSGERHWHRGKHEPGAHDDYPPHLHRPGIRGVIELLPEPKPEQVTELPDQPPWSDLH